MKTLILQQNSPAKGGIRTLWQRHRRINNQNSNVIKERALGRRRRSNSFHLSSTSSMSTLLDEKSMLPQLPTQGVSCTINHPAIQALRVQQVRCNAALQRFFSSHSLGFNDEVVKNCPGWWADTVAAYCPSQPGSFQNLIFKTLQTSG